MQQKTKGKNIMEIICSVDCELRAAIYKKADLLVIRYILESYKRHGVKSSEVISLLEEFRLDLVNEAIEDKILEVMDIVSGFCSPHMKVW